MKKILVKIIKNRELSEEDQLNAEADEMRFLKISQAKEKLLVNLIQLAQKIL